MTEEPNSVDVRPPDAELGSCSETGVPPEKVRFRMFGRAVAEWSATVWRWGRDRQLLLAIIGRYSAHLAIVSLAALIGVVGRVTLTPVGAVGSSTSRSLSLPAAAEPVASPTASEDATSALYELQRPRAVVRQANPLTTIPERERLEVITYTVESGDNIFFIAEKFKLSYTTIVWSNMETLQGAPWLIQPGLTLFIPPVDGVYHTVMDGENAEAIAEKYDVPVDALYNNWNSVERGQALAVGAQLVIPGGIGEDFDLEAPPPEPSSPAVGVASASWGYCGDTAVSGYGANGWFILPTGSYAVSWLAFCGSEQPRTHRPGLPVPSWRSYLRGGFRRRGMGGMEWRLWKSRPRSARERL